MLNSRWPLEFLFVQILSLICIYYNSNFYFFPSALFFSDPSLLHVQCSLSYLPPIDNYPSIWSTSVAVGMLTALFPLSVLGVCKVGCVPITSTTTSVSSLLSIVSSYPPIMEVPVSSVSSLSFSAYVESILLICLPPIWLGLPTTATALALPSEIVSLVSHPTVIKETDLFRSHLSK